MFILSLIISVVVPITVIICGNLLKHNTPAEINSIYGYRTKRSMSSQEAWEFANKLCGGMWIKGGIISLPLSLICVLIICIRFGSRTGIGAATILEIVQVGLMLSTIYFVERQLKRNFEDKNTQKGKADDKN